MATTTKTSYIRPNPALQRGFFGTGLTHGLTGTSAMTVAGAINCTAVFLFAVTVAAAIGWNVLPIGGAIVAMLAAVGLGIYTSFKPQHAQTTGLLYALCEGLAVGALSRVYNDQYEGVVLTALVLTLAIAASTLALYRSGAIKVTQRFRSVVFVATAGLMLFYLVDIIAGLFSAHMPLVQSNSTGGILFSVFVVLLASANLVVNMDFISQGAHQGLPKYMEWYAAFGIMVTLVWLYLEVLRLVAKLRE